VFENLFGGGGKQQNKSPKKPAAGIKPAIQIGVGAPTVGSPATNAGGQDLAAELENVKQDVEKLKDSVNAIRSSLKNLNEKMDKLEKHIAELASIYELVTNQTNPFLDEDERKAAAKKVGTIQTVPAAAPAAPVAPKEEEPEVVLPSVDLTNPKVIQTILDWMQFIVERVGHAGVDDVLQYYVDIHWISQEVAEILKRYADGIRVEIEPEVEEPVQLDPEDHMKSLDYIMQIKEFQGQ